jgi:hypothetical protein
LRSTLKLTARILALAVVSAPLGCARPAVVRERLADGSFTFKCDDALWACLSHVDEVCKGGPYVVEGGWDEPKMSGVDQYQVESHRSRAHVRCVRPGTLSKNMPVVTAPVVAHVVPGTTKPPSPPATVPARACVPGATQACVGPAACSGGQACLADGSGFGPCDCGAH